MTEPTFTATASPPLRWLLWSACGLGAAASAVAATQVVGEDRVALLVSVPVLLAVALVVEASFSSVRLRVLPDQVRVEYGRTPFATRLRHDQITGVEVIDIRAWKWGWGYRGSRRLFKRAGIVVRSGDAVRFDLVDGTSLAVTIDDAEQAARAVQAATGRG